MPSPASPSAKINCAVVGLKQGLETAYVLLHHPQLALKLVCDVDPEPFAWMTGRLDPAQSQQDWPHIPVAKRLLGELLKSPGLGQVEFESDYAAVLRRPDIEAVLLFTPDALHEPQTIDALQAGKYVLCTKPMALSVESAQRIAAVARNFPHHYMLGFQFIFTPFARQIVQEIKRGALGTVRQMSFHYHRGPFRPIYRHKAVSGGAIVQECCHWLDLFHLFTGSAKFTKVTGFGGLDLHGDIQDIEDNGAVVIEYGNQIRAALLFTYFRRSAHPEFFTLNGERGQIRGTFDQLLIEDEHGDRTVQIAGNRKLPGLIHEGYYEMHDEFAAMIRTQTEPYCGWEAGLENVLICDAAQQALDRGGVVLRGQ